jgi:hypothetical protein
VHGACARNLIRRKMKLSRQFETLSELFSSSGNETYGRTDRLFPLCSHFIHFEQLNCTKQKAKERKFHGEERRNQVLYSLHEFISECVM